MSALRLAHSAQVLTVLNPAPAQALPGELLVATDILVPDLRRFLLAVGIALERQSDRFPLFGLHF